MVFERSWRVQKYKQSENLKIRPTNQVTGVSASDAIASKKVCWTPIPAWEETCLQRAKPRDIPHLPNAPGAQKMRDIKVRNHWDIWTSNVWDITQIPRYIITLHELLAHTPPDHVEKNSLEHARWHFLLNTYVREFRVGVWVEVGDSPW